MCRSPVARVIPFAYHPHLPPITIDERACPFLLPVIDPKSAPFGSETWTQQALAALELKHTQSSGGRPRKGIFPFLYIPLRSPGDSDGGKSGKICNFLARNFD